MSRQVPENIYKVVVKFSDQPINHKQVHRTIIKIKYYPEGGDEAKLQKLKERIFLKSSVMILKAINNFFNLVRESPPEKILHTREDICGECYLILINCVNKVNIKEINKFYFYFNTALNRGLHRLYSKNYKKHYPVIVNSENTEAMVNNKKYVQDFGLVTMIDLSTFTEEELDFINFKISGQKLKIYLEKKKMLSSRFYQVAADVENKLRVLYGDDIELKKYFEDDK